MKKQIMIFITGFIQVLLVSANIYFISRTNWIGIAICGFGISYVWTVNVKKIAIGKTFEQIIYSTGAAMGGLVGVVLAKFI